MSKVLLINDCKFESIVMKDMLTGLGYSVKIGSEYEAIKQISEYSPDVVICNLIMKETTGDELINKIKTQKPDLKCLLSSNNKVSLRDFKDKKLDGIIHTPTDKVSLEKILDSLKEISFEELLAVKQRIKEREIQRKINEKQNIAITTQKDFAFCPYCGKEFEEEKSFAFCPFCGKKL